MKKIIYFIAVIFIVTMAKKSNAQTQFVVYHAMDGAFGIADKNFVAPLVMSSDDWQGVSLALNSLQTDIKNVTDKEPAIVTDVQKISGKAIIVGTIGHSKIIDDLIRNRKINVAGVAGKWESTLIQTVDSPVAGIGSALVIAGSDKRGTIYGIYEISRQIGVSPWYWWADVPIEKHESLYAISQKIILKSPAVKYRGIFFNDEAPSLTGWVREKYGNYNHQFYEKVFELLLRLKANYMWPAMWNNAFNDDDTLNPVLADEYGIVMGTSHHEPMLRAQQEWKRYGKGAWNYEENKQVLQNFWRTGIEHMGTHESIVTIGMRGDGDMPMTEGSNIALLENIVKDQRQIIADVTKKPASATPQLWALYKEVQDYYDKGMRVPDDVTLLLCDDNWGNIRKLPKLTDNARSGGYGIYYHFDYVGDPRNYKWINTSPIDKTWEQMHLAYKYGVDKIWIVNVGDLKPLEFPVQFFLDYARDPDAIPFESLHQYTIDWCTQQFGSLYAPAIADIINKYTKYNGRIKPELMNAETYSLTNFNEWEKVVDDYTTLAKASSEIYSKLPEKYKAAYFELVEYPVQASQNLYSMYLSQALNKLHAKQGYIGTNQDADFVKFFYGQDSVLSYKYNKINAGGKWNHMMDQTHIGYTYWQQPEHQTMPKIDTIVVPNVAAMGISVDGDTLAFPDKNAKLQLPEQNFYANNSVSFTIFSRGQKDFSYKIQSPFDWLKFSSLNGTIVNHTRENMIDGQKKIDVSVDWERAPQNDFKDIPVKIMGAGKTAIIHLSVRNKRMAEKPRQSFVEQDSIVSVNAGDFISSTTDGAIHWKILSGLGKTKNAIEPFPVTEKRDAFSVKNASVVYPIFTIDSGDAQLTVLVSPTFDMWAGTGLKFAVAIDDEQPQIININQDNSDAAWRNDVANSIRKVVSVHHIAHAGAHTIRVWAISPAVVIQKLILNFGHEKYSFLGAPESYFSK